MKGEVKLISWHEKQPILSLDCHPTSRRIATGGADNNVRIWMFHHDSPQDSPQPEVVTTSETKGKKRAGAGVPAPPSQSDEDDGDIVDLSDAPVEKPKPKEKPAKAVTFASSSSTAAAPAAFSSVEYLATLSRHTLAVNSVRFSPNGQLFLFFDGPTHLITSLPPLSTFHNIFPFLIR